MAGSERARREAAWLKQVIAGLDDLGPLAQDASAYMRAHRTVVTMHEQPTGARWRLRGRIEVHPRFATLPESDLMAASLIIHEVRHLQQGCWTALSVWGELDAWQLQFRFLKQRLGRYQENPALEEIIERLMQLPLGWDRAVLARARSLMREYAGPQYRVDLLPLYPLPAELLYRMGGRGPTSTSP